MKHFKNILVVTEPSTKMENNPALKRAVKLAKQNQAKLTILEVVSDTQGLLKDYEGIIQADELTQIIINNRRKEVSETRLVLTEEVSEIDEIVIAGKDFIEIIRQVLTAQHDLVIKTANPGRHAYSSGDFHLMRKCPCPVWLIKPDHDSSNSKILAAIDLALEKTAEGQVMNALIMDLATSLQTMDDGELHLLSCWSLFGEGPLRDSPFLGVTKDKLSELLDNEKSLNAQLQNTLCLEYQQAPIVKHLIKGSPDTSIPEFVKQHEIDTVVMGTVGRTGIPGFFIGNTAESVLQSISSSVITVKPQGFKSPVE